MESCADRIRRHAQVPARCQLIRITRRPVSPTPFETRGAPHLPPGGCHAHGV